ncbi:MAG: DNA internalization-related competence protein ComEC/Rec2 [Lachnospiraceae bacterium]|nr:DNA internalization-related competence protein ComEC/Rec2 [Lachnospiraceae bacterium]
MPERGVEEDAPPGIISGTVTGKDRKAGEEMQLHLTVRQSDGWNVLCVFRGEEAVIDETDRRFPIGCKVTLRGRVRAFSGATNPGEQDSAAYYRIKKYKYRLSDPAVLEILPPGRSPATILGNVLYRVRRFLSVQVIGRWLPEEEAAVIRAMLLGETGYLSPELKELYRVGGISHILAISGLHITFLGMGLQQLLKKARIPAAPAGVLSCAAMLLFGMMTGMSASAARAIIMFLMHVAAGLCGRSYDMLTGLCAAALLLLTGQPLYLHHSGFLFSFGAVLGIGLLTPAFKSAAGKALAVPLATLPVHLLYYFTFPVWSIAVNALVIPLAGVLLTLAVLLIPFGTLAAAGALTAPCSLACRGIAQAVRGILTFCSILCRVSDHLPGSGIIPGAPSPTRIALYLLMLAALAAAGPETFHITEEQKARWITALQERFRIATAPQIAATHRSTAIWVALRKALWIAAAIAVLCLRGQPAIKMTVLDVGQGDGILVQTKEGNFMFDGGSSDVQGVGEYRIEPFLMHEAACTIDLWVVSHSDEDHCSGLLYFLENETPVRIRAIALPDVAEEMKEANYRKIEALAKERGIPIAYLHAGQEISAKTQGRSLLPQRNAPSILCLHPAAGGSYSSANSGSAVVAMRVGGYAFLLTGDLEAEGEAQVIQEIREHAAFFEGCSLILKAAHHGSATATTKAFLGAVRPAVSIISCGRNNRYGHPAAETLERLERAGSEIFLTPQDGAVTVTVRGKRCRVETFLR